MFPLAILLAETLLLLIFRTEASSLATYNDSTCEPANLVQNIAAANGYPSGSCTSLSSSTTDSNAPTVDYLSFQFLTVDSGCGITIYQPDTNELTCSGYPVLGSLNTCYNSSWAYYSLDYCDIPDGLSSASSSSSSTAVATSSAAQSTTDTTDTVPASLTAGDVAGVALGCIAGTAAVLGMVWFMMRRRRVAEQQARAAGQALKEQQARAEPRPAMAQHSWSQSPQQGHQSQEQAEAPGTMHYGSEVDGRGYIVELHGKEGPLELA
ncbi:unnamed protein product [Discula destructiva]